MMADIEADLKAVLAAAPTTHCGRCRAIMTAQKVTVTISCNFTWNRIEPEPDITIFLSALPRYVDPYRYDGDVEYHCAKCGNILHHKQRVWRDDDGGFHFKPPSEEPHQPHHKS